MVTFGRQRLSLFDGMAPYLWFAGVFVVLGVLAFLLEIQSPSWVQWNGIKVHGYTQNGLTYYSYRGEKFAVDNTHASAFDSRRVPTAVWLPRSDPTDSSRAYIDNKYNRWLDFAFVGGWFLMACIAVGVGLATRWAHRRRRIESMGMFGGGISDEAMRRYLAHQRGAPPPPGS